MLVLIIILIALVLVWFLGRKLKKLNLPNISLVTGGVKTGKSALSLHLAIKQYKKQLRKFKVQKLLNRKTEKPLFYSNIPLNVPFDYVLINIDILMRDNRINYKSVMFIDECSLLANSMAYKDNEVNEQLLLFNKLYGHYSKGGYLFYNTQSLADCHYNIKRCISNYLYIDNLKRYPFLSVASVRLMNYCSDNESVINLVNDNEEVSYKKVIMFNSIFKKYDCYCYSVLTDNLPLKNDVEKRKGSLKTDNVVSFIKFKNLKKGGVNNDNKN